MYYLSALLAIIGAVSYQTFVKRVPADLNPIVSVLALYVGVLFLGLFLLVLFPVDSGLSGEVRKLSWIQLALAGSVMMMELGFLLMYRFGWNLSTGNIVTGVFINILLVAVGVALIGEKVSLINAAGIALSIIGVALISYQP